MAYELSDQIAYDLVSSFSLYNNGYWILTFELAYKITTQISY
jgi:hypothetical protein